MGTTDRRAIVAVSTGMGVRATHEEMVAAALSRWEPAVIEKALGRDAKRVLPEAIRLFDLRARVPRYQKEMPAVSGAAGGDVDRRGAVARAGRHGLGTG